MRMNAVLALICITSVSFHVTCESIVKKYERKVTNFFHGIQKATKQNNRKLLEKSDDDSNHKSKKLGKSLLIKSKVDNSKSSTEVPETPKRKVTKSRLATEVVEDTPPPSSKKEIDERIVSKVDTERNVEQINNSTLLIQTVSADGNTKPAGASKTLKGWRERHQARKIEVTVKDEPETNKTTEPTAVPLTGWREKHAKHKLLVDSTSTIVESSSNITAINSRKALRAAKRTKVIDECTTSNLSNWTYNTLCSSSRDSQAPPNEWSQEYPLCSGSFQSPINIDTTRILSTCGNGPVTKFYKEDRGTCTFDDLVFDTSIQGWKVLLNEEACGISPSIMINSMKHSLQKMEFHLKSEHSIDGLFGDAELQMVFIDPLRPNESVNIAIIIMANETLTGYTEIDNYWGRLEHFSKRRDGKHEKFNRILKTDKGLADPLQFIPSSNTYFTYSGSKTSPPCTENIRWVILPTFLYVSPIDLKSFGNAIISQKGSIVDSNGSTSRPVQELKTRAVQICAF